MLKTSYFASPYLKAVNRRRCVCISLGNPARYRRVLELAPKRDMLHFGSWKEYVSRYEKEILSKLNAREVYKHIIEVGGKNAILVCFERPEKNCHRHLAARWLEKKLGIKVPELGYEEYKRRNGRIVVPQQARIFG